MYIKFLPSEYVLRYKNGKVVKEGAGLSFFFLEKNTAACMIPISNNDTDFIFEERTADHQSVIVQGQLTFKAVDFKTVANAFDFTVNLKTKAYYNDPLAKLAKRVMNIARVIVKRHIGEADLTSAIAGEREFAAVVLDEIGQVEEIKALGIRVDGFSILSIAPTKETIRALEAKTREDILKQSDDALYERRNASIEQERRVKENELNTEISVEDKRKAIKEREINTKKMVIEKENEFEIIKAENQAKCEKIKIAAQIEIEKQREKLEQLKLENAKKQADAQAYRVRSLMQAYNELNKDVLVALATLNMEPERMIAKAFENLAANTQKVGSLNISPDFLESIKTKVDAQ